MAAFRTGIGAVGVAALMMVAAGLAGSRGRITAAPSDAAAPQRVDAKKLIEFGWDEPDTGFLRRQIGQMEQQPFDGCVFTAQYTRPGDKPGRFSWDGWGKRAIAFESLQPALNDLRATKFHRFTDNFLRFNVTPGDVDWFESFEPILNNAQQAARLAREGGSKGICFDTEPYAGRIWDYRRRPLAGQKSWTEYEAQARYRGREVMGAFQAGFPNLTLFLPISYSHIWKETNHGRQPLQESAWGLLAPFLDGMIDAAAGQTRLVDGHEQSYDWKELALFANAYHEARNGLLPLVSNPTAYQQRLSIGFGLWMDCSTNSTRKRTWHPNNFSKNYFTPEEFGASLRRALEVADEYVWVYTQQPRWWSEQGGRIALPDAYADAVAGAREGLTGQGASAEQHKKGIGKATLSS